MFYDFEEEIKVLEESDIKDKEKIFYIYTEFYTSIIDIISDPEKGKFCSVNTSFICDVQRYLLTFFKDTIDHFNLEHNNRDYIEILEYYVRYIHDKFLPYAEKLYYGNGVSSMEKIIAFCSHIREYIELREHFFEYQIKQFENITNNLNLTNLDFRAKAISILNIKYHIKEILFQNYTFDIHYFFGGYTINKPVRIIDPSNTLDKLIDCIPTLVSSNEPISYEVLKEKTFEFFNEEISEINPGFDESIRNEELLKYYLSLDEDNKKLFWQVITRFLSGYPYDYEPNTYNEKELMLGREKNQKRELENV